MNAPGGKQPRGGHEPQVIENDARNTSPGSTHRCARSAERVDGRGHRLDRDEVARAAERTAGRTDSSASKRQVQGAPRGLDREAAVATERVVVVERAAGDRRALGRPAGVRTPVGRTCSSTSTCSHAGQRSDPIRSAALPGAGGTGASRTRSALRARPVGVRRSSGGGRARRVARRPRRRGETGTPRASRDVRRSRTAARSRPGLRARTTSKARGAQVAVDRQAVAVVGRSRARAGRPACGRRGTPTRRAGCPTGARAAPRSSIRRGSRRAARGHATYSSPRYCSDVHEHPAPGQEGRGVRRRRAA